jgi:phospholipase/carboxylesterase
VTKPNPSGVDTFVHAWEPPVDGAASSRTLILLHGTGGNERSLLRLGELLDPQAGRLAPRGKVLEGSMPRFFRRLAEGVFDLEDLVTRTHELATWIEAAWGHYHLRVDATSVVGYSNGANIAGAMLLLRPGVIRRAVLLRPMLPLLPEVLPDLRGTQVLIAAGRQDRITPAASAQQLGELLRKAGCEVTIALDEGDHALPREAIETARQWLSVHSGAASTER